MDSGVVIHPGIKFRAVNTEIYLRLLRNISSTLFEMSSRNENKLLGSW
jgi:hypothetical protein